MIIQEKIHVFPSKNKSDLSLLQSESAYLDMESKAIELATEIGAEYWSVSSLSGKYLSKLCKLNSFDSNKFFCAKLILRDKIFCFQNIYVTVSFRLKGENVRDFFFRAVSLTFDRQVMNEVDSVNSSSTKQIGSELISK